MAIQNVRNSLKKKKKETEEAVKRTGTQPKKATTPAKKSTPAKNVAKKAAQSASKKTAQKVTYYSKSKGATGAARNTAQKAAQTVKKDNRYQQAAKNLPTRAYQKGKSAQTIIKGNQIGMPISQMINNTDTFKPGTFATRRGVNTEPYLTQAVKALYASEAPRENYGLAARSVMMSPMEALQERILTGKDQPVYYSKRSDKDKALDIVENAKRRLRNRKVEKQYVSEYDRKYMNDAQIRQKQDASLRYKEAQQKGDKEGMAKAHRDADMLRELHGYSGGVAGDQYISPDVPQDVRNRLNDDGILAWKQATMKRQRAVTEDEIAKADKRIEEILNAKGFQKKGRDINTARGMQETAEGRSTLLGANKEQRAQDFEKGFGLATKAGIHQGIGGMGTYGEAYVDYMNNREREKNLDKWSYDELDLASAQADLDYYDNFVKEFGHPPEGMDRTKLVLRLYNASVAKHKMDQLWQDPDSIYFNEAKARADLEAQGLSEEEINKRLHPGESYWQKMLRQGKEEQAKSNEGLNAAEKWLNDLYINEVQQIPTVASFLIPGGGEAAAAARLLPLLGMGASAGGQRYQELTDQGYTGDQAFIPATVAFGIESGTELLPMENIGRIVGGKASGSVMKNILTQAAAEGAEEGVNYLANMGYNRYANLPGQEFDAMEMLSQIAAGAVMGGVHAGAGTVVNQLTTESQVRQAERNYQMDEANRIKDVASQIKSWHDMVDMGAVSREEGQAVLSQLSAEIGSNRILTKEEADLWSGVAELQTQYLQGEISRKEKVKAQDQAVKELERTSGEQTATLWDDAWKSADNADNTKQPGYAMKMYRQAQQTLAKAAEAEKQAEQKQAEQTTQTPVETVEDRKGQADLPPLQWERSRFPMTSMLGAAIDSYRENQAKKAREEQMREWEAQTAERKTAPTETQQKTQTESARPQDPVYLIGSKMGKSGQEAIQSAARYVSGENRRSVFGDAFSYVYDQAMSGRAVEKPNVLTESQYNAAMRAGAADRVTYLSASQRKAGSATRAKYAGLVRDSYTKQNLSKEDARLLDGMARSGGTIIRFVDPSELDNPKAQGQVDGNVIKISKNADDAVAFVAGHEITHRMQEVAPEAYQAFQDYVMTKASMPWSVDAKISEYARSKVSLDRQKAMNEITADYAGNLFRDVEELRKFITDNYTNKTLLEKVLDAIRNLAAALTGKDKAQADEAVRLLEEALRSSSEAVEKMGTDRTGLAGQNDEVDPPARYSISSLGDALGFDVRDYVDGHVEFYRDGKQVKKVTAADVKKSRMGQMIVLANQNGFITDKDVNKQMKYLARLANMILETKDAQMVYAFAGSMSWSAVKDNADKQYGMTIDFEAICKKTEAMVAAMSEAMMRKGRGLTLEEIDILYSKVVQAGETVPCPPCYVFSRWIGLGGLLDNIKSFQTEFPDTADGTAKARRRLQEIRDILADDIEELKEQDDERVRKNKEAAANGAKKTKRDLTPKSLDDLTNAAKKKRLEQLNNEENKLITRRNKALSKLQFDDLTEAERAKVEDDLKKVDTAYAEFTRQNRIMRMYSWLKDVRLSESYKEVPDSILFDLRAGEKFAGMYEDTWAFRTGQGAYYGKAITPYTDARLGEIIQGVHKKAAEIKIGDANPFSGTFDAMDLTSKQKTELNAAYTAVKRQNLRGGVRMQSVSDFRYEYGLDYIQSFFELQAIGAAIQTYTKVVEFVDMASSTGAFVNMSLIPWGMGFKDGKLAYSSVTGMDAEAAFELQKQWDTAGTILIGVSDEHIRAAMADDNIYFIIPYHKSGGRDDVIRGMLKALDERIEKYEDYTNVQGEEFPANANPVLTLRNKILTASGFFELNSKERALVEENEFLRSLYNRKFYQQGDPLYGVKMTSEDCKHIYPYEYWDPTSTYKTADINGRRYLEWCEALGVIPKFSGESKGKHDFRHDKGYWKLLIDRRMYDRRGRYIPLTPINVSGLDLKQLDQERARERFGKAMTAPADLKKTQGIVDAAFPDTAEGARFSISSKTDADYMAAVERGDMETAQKMVAEAAKKAGYTIKAYHGTGRADRVGTVFRPDRATSGPMAFFTDNREIAENYSKGKQDTSIAYDTDYDSYESQFRTTGKRSGRDKSLVEAWRILSYPAQARIKEKAGHVREDWDGDNEIIYDPDTNEANGGFQWQIKESRGNIIQALTDQWLNSGNLFNEEDRFLEVLEKAGVTEELEKAGWEAPRYMNPDYREEKVYDTYLRITHPFDATNQVTEDFIKAYEDWYNEQDQDQYASENMGSDLWDKNGVTAETFAERMRNDLERGTSHAWTSIPDSMTDFLKSMDYDGIVDKGGKNGGESHTVYIPFTSEQVKDSSPVTYDDNGNVIPLSERFDTEEKDIRRSLKGSGADQARLMRENQQLRDKVDYWKSQTKRSDRTKVDPKEVRKLAKKLASDYTTTMDTSEIAGQLQAIYDGLGKEWTYDQAYEAARRLAGEMIQQASETDDYLYNEYEPMRQFFREQPLVITPELQRGIADYNDWRKAQMGKMRIQHGDVSNVDQVYQELSQRWPEWFDETKESHSLDQLERISEVLDEIYAREETNPFGDDMETPASYLAAEIMESFWDMPNVQKTFADRAEARLGREVSRRLEMQEKYQETLQKVRENRDEKLKAQKEKYLGKEKARSQRQKERERRAQIMRHAKALSKKLLKPSDKQHIPDTFMKTVATVLDSVDLSSSKHKDTNRTKAFQELRLAYEEIKKQGESLVIDPDLMDNISEVEAMRDTPIQDLNLSQLETIWKTIRAVEASITTANKAFGRQRFATIFEAADGLRQSMGNRKDRGDYRGPIGAFDKLLNSGMLTPESYFHRMGQTGQDIFKMLRNAQDKHIGIMQEAQDHTQDILYDILLHEKPSKNPLVKKAQEEKLRKIQRKMEKEVHTFDFDGKKVQLTTAQIMSLYELLKRQQAVDHIMIGGVRPEVIEKGIKKNAPSKPMRLTPEQISEITDVLTEDQVKMADALQKYMGGRLAELGNEASMAVYGYKKFNEKHYFPIDTDENQVATDPAKKAQQKTVPGRGFTKATTPKANNALILRNILDVYADHVTDMATYAAWLEAMENLNRIHNFTFRDADGNRTGTVKDLLEKTFGKNGLSYWDKLTEDLNNGVQGTDDNPLNALIGNYKASAIGANIRVFVQQPTAILRALDDINPADFLAGLAKARLSTWAKVKKYAPIAVWKDWGYFDANTGRQMKSILFGDDSALAKVNNTLMAPAGMMDSIGWSQIWNALEVETRRTRKDLKPRSEEFYQAVALRFNEVIDHSQVVDGILQRSQAMRYPDALSKMATSFMAEPTKVYNMFTTSLYDLKRSQDPKERAQAMKKVGRTAFGLIASFFANAAAQSLVDALRDDDKDEEYWEKFLQAFYGLEGDAETTAEKIKNGVLKGNLGQAFNPMAYIPYVKDALSIWQGFKVTRMDMDSISKFSAEIANTWKAIHGDSKITLQNALARLTAEGARLLGIPAANIKRDVLAIYSTIMNNEKNYVGQFELQKWLYRIDNSNNWTDFVKIAYSAQQAGDTAAYKKIKAELVDVMGQEKFDEKMKNLGKKELEAGGDHAEEFNRVYGTYETQMAGNPLYSEMPAEQKAKVEASLKQYASDQVMYDASSGEITSNDTEMAAIKEAEAAGIDPVTYKSFRVYYNGLASDKDENGKDIPGQTKQDKTIRAIEELELPAEQSSYLYHTCYSSDANNPWA